MPIKSSDFLLIVISILFPPAAALFISGCSCDFLISILLTLIGALPGHVHAFWLIYKKVKAEEKYGPGGSRYMGYGYFEPLEGQGTTSGLPPPPAYGSV